MTQQIDRETDEALDAAIQEGIKALEEAAGALEAHEALEAAAFRASETYPSNHPKNGRFIAFAEPERLRELYRVVRQAQKGEST